MRYKQSLGPLDGAAETGRIVRFVKKVLRDSGATGVVLGVSGGVDSAVVGELCVRSLGKDRVMTVMMPSAHTPAGDVTDANYLMKRWGTKKVVVQISPLAIAVIGRVGERGSNLAEANLQARVRMAILYFLANSHNLLVAGTGDRSELGLGYFTKFGDGGVDFLPIGHLYKTQVRELGKFLGIPASVVTKPASPGLWTGHKATDELPADYPEIDTFLHATMDEESGVAVAAKKAGVSLTVAKELLAMIKKGAHKRNLPPSLRPA